jgi:hypothetical protein
MVGGGSSDVSVIIMIADQALVSKPPESAKFTRNISAT